MVYRDSDDEESNDKPKFAFQGGGTAVLPSRDIQHAWFELTRTRPWRSVALVPVEDSGSSVGLAYELAQMAALDPRNKVLVVNAATVLNDAFGGPMAGQGQGQTQVVQQGKFWLLDCAKQGLDDATVGMVEVPRFLEPMRRNEGAFNMMIVASNSLLASPGAVSVARSVDTVVLCPTLGITTFQDAKRTMELVGEENIAGTIALRPRS